MGTQEGELNTCASSQSRWAKLFLVILQCEGHGVDRASISLYCRYASLFSESDRTAQRYPRLRQQRPVATGKEIS